MTAVDALIVALADGQSMRDAALTAGMPSAIAVREAKVFGWPHLDSIRAAAEEIRERHATTTTPDPGDPVPRKPEPIPVEPDVEALMTRGAAAYEDARASVALDRDQTHEVVDDQIPHHLDAIVDRTDEAEFARGVWDTAHATVDATLIEGPAVVAPVLDAAQRARVAAVREARDVYVGAATLDEILLTADYIVTGTVPPLPTTAGAS